jgi:NAD(P)-dependent dehydrogenase (short-subunit alcohol dehydrogenase family)
MNARVLDGKVVLVTGAGSGIGKAAAMLLSREGARVGLVGLDPESLGGTAAGLQGPSLVLAADVSDDAQVRSACERLGNEYGRIDGVFANAGINGVWAPIEELDRQEWDRTIAVNLTGSFLTIKYAVPWLKRQGGSVVITSSVNGTRMFSNIGATAYSCSKAGQVALAKMLALELAHWRIRANVICPGRVATHIEESTIKQDLDTLEPMAVYPHGSIPLTDGRAGRPLDVAQLVLFLLSDASHHVSGTEIWIDGAESLLVG